MAKTPPSEPLGIGTLVSQSFGLSLRRAPLFLGIALVPSLVQILLQVALVQNSFEMLATVDMPTVIGGIAVAVLASLILTLLTVGAITLAAYDSRLGRPVRLGAYIWRTLAAAPSLIVLAIAVGAAIMGVTLAIGTMGAATETVGGVLLIVPLGLGVAFWLVARYWVVVPAVLVERAGLSGLRRSAELTAGYRWPILGAVFLFVLALVIVSLVLGAASSVVFVFFGTGAFLPGSGVGYLALVAAQAVITAIQLALLSVFTALLYARLRALKEGLGVEDLVAVFT